STSPNVCPLLKRNAVTFSEETLLETLKESLSLKNSNEVNTNTNTTNINNQVESLSSLIPSSTTKIVSSPSTTNSTILTQTLSSKSTTSRASSKLKFCIYPPTMTLTTLARLEYSVHQCPK